MAELADRLGITVSSVSTLELNDERGTAKTSTVEKAMLALDLARLDIVVPAGVLERAIKRSEDLANYVNLQMSLEGQELGEAALARIAHTLVVTTLGQR